jgi:hypothetical protein
MQARPCQQHEVHLSLIQAASQVQDTGGGSYLTRSYAVSQAQEAGPTGLHFLQSVGQRGLSLMSEHHSHTIRVIQPVNNRCYYCLRQALTLPLLGQAAPAVTAATCNLMESG